MKRARKGTVLAPRSRSGPLDSRLRRFRILPADAAGVADSSADWYDPSVASPADMRQRKKIDLVYQPELPVLVPPAERFRLFREALAERLLGSGIYNAAEP
jgi:hypothetical protein